MYGRIFSSIPVLPFECSVSISSAAFMFPVCFPFLLVLVQSYQTHGFQLGLIGNVSLIGSQGFQINQTSCSQCACRLAVNDTLFAFNCHLSNNTCEVFTAYNTTIAYVIQTNPNSTFYFRQLPPISLMTTENYDTGRSLCSSGQIRTSEKFENLTERKIHRECFRDGNLRYKPTLQKSRTHVGC